MAWNYRTGQRGLNRVRAFQQDGRFYVEWWEGTARRRERVRTQNRKEAARRAVEKASELALAVPGRALVGPTIDAYLGAHEVKWSDSHLTHCEQFASYWKLTLGEETPLDSLTPVDIESQVKSGLSRRTTQSYLKFMRAVSRWAYRKKLIAHDVLDGIEMPTPATGGPAYSNDELDRISDVAVQVSRAFRALWEIVRSTGRRLSAVRSLRAEDLEWIDGRLAVNFPAQTDKARQRGRAFLSTRAQSAVEVLGIEQGWLFGDDGVDRPVSAEAAIRLLRAAEKLAGVPHVKGRGFHGVKRRVVTEILSKTGDADLAGRVTGTQTTWLIEQTYRQQHDDDLLRAADLLDTLPTRQDTSQKRKSKKDK